MKEELPKYPSGRIAWTRSESAIQKSENFGARLRQVRSQRGLSLGDLSKATGVPAATLSRIENNKMSPTLTIVLSILSGLRVELSDLLFESEEGTPKSGLSINRFKQGAKFSLPAGEFMPLHGDIPNRAMGASMILIAPQPSDAEPELIGHGGEEFFCLMEGEIMLKVKGQPPVTLGPGDTAYFDSSQPHIYVALNNEPALGVIVHYSGRPPDAERDAEFYKQRWEQTQD